MRLAIFACVLLLLERARGVAESVALAQRGLRLIEQGLHAEAVAVLERSIELDDEDGTASSTLLTLGLVWEELDLPMKALESYGRALELNPSSAAAHVKFGAALENHLNERTAAIEAVSAAVELDPTSGEAWDLLGTLHHSSGAMDEAQRALSRAVELRPADAAVRRSYATALRATGRFEESLEQLRQAHASDGAPDPSLAFPPGLTPAELSLIHI